MSNPELVERQARARPAKLQAEGDDLNGQIAIARAAMEKEESKRVFYFRQVAEGNMRESELKALLAEADEEKAVWEARVAELTQIRDEAARLDNTLSYSRELLQQIEARIPQLDYSLEELAQMDAEQRDTILRARRETAKALIEEVTIWSDKSIELSGLIDGTEGAPFGLQVV